MVFLHLPSPVSPRAASHRVIPRRNRATGGDTTRCRGGPVPSSSPSWPGWGLPAGRKRRTAQDSEGATEGSHTALRRSPDPPAASEYSWTRRTTSCPRGAALLGLPGLPGPKLRALGAGTCGSCHCPRGRRAGRPRGFLHTITTRNTFLLSFPPPSPSLPFIFPFLSLFLFLPFLVSSFPINFPSLYK